MLCVLYHFVMAEWWICTTIPRFVYFWVNHEYPKTKQTVLTDSYFTAL